MPMHTSADLCSTSHQNYGFYQALCDSG